MRQDPFAKERAALRKPKGELNDLAKLIIEKAKGDKGDTPVKGKDYFTPAERKELIAEILERIPRPKDAKEVDYDLVLTYVADQVDKQVKAEVAKLPKPKDGTPGKDAVINIPAIVADLLKAMPKMKAKDVDYIGIKAYIDKEVAKIKAERPKNVNSFTGGSAQYISQLMDVDLTSLTKNDVGQYILGSGERITVSATAPSNPQLNALWVDLS
jgi:hypothetical protein